MIATKQNFKQILDKLSKCKVLSLDTETTGLRPYHGDRLFSIIIGDLEGNAYYFNFSNNDDFTPDEVLNKGNLNDINFTLFKDPNKKWFIHNASFDLSILAVEGIEILGKMHCTKVVARLIKNDHNSYDLDSCAERIGFKKSNEVEKYVAENGLWGYEQVPGKKKRVKNKFYSKVPRSIIVPYAETDAKVCAALGQNQGKALDAIEYIRTRAVLENELRLIKTVHRMHHLGILVDKEYCLRAIAHEEDLAQRAENEFEIATGRPLVISAKALSPIFESEKSKWAYTEKGNPSFDGDALLKFDNPIAKTILQYRDAKARANYYHGFLYHADSNGVVHAHLNQSDTATGRFSSAEPNLQNLTNEEGEEDKEFLVRRAFIPRPGFLFVSCDFSQVEFRFALELACKEVGYQTELAKQVAGGLDFHQATTDLVNSQSSVKITRSQAKTVVFSLLYGSGVKHLAEGLRISEAEAKTIKDAVFEAAPELKTLINKVSTTARIQGYTYTWLGRMLLFGDPETCYRTPNHLIQGGCADILKVAMNRVDDYLMDKKSKMLLTIHDELIIETHESEVGFVPQKVKEIMETTYISKYVPILSSVAHSRKSLGDMTDGFPEPL